MRLTLLGTGDAAGVPVYGCDCSACKRARQDPAWRRRPCSALLETGAGRYLIDAGLTELAERFPLGSLDGIFLTHFHPDHVQGLFHWRWGQGPTLPVYCPRDSEGCADLYKHPGMLEFRPQRKLHPISLPGLTVTPVALIHSRPTLGYCFESGDARIAYLTDTHGLPKPTLVFLRDWRPQTLVLDTRSPPGDEPPRNHNDVGTTTTIHSQVAPQQTIMTHIGHQLDQWLLTGGNRYLADGITVGYDDTLIETGSID